MAGCWPHLRAVAALSYFLKMDGTGDNSGKGAAEKWSASSLSATTLTLSRVESHHLAS